MQRYAWLVLVVLAVCAVLPLTGCIKVDAQLRLQPDLSLTGKMLLGVDSRLGGEMSGGQGTPFGDLKSGPMGDLWTVREFEEGGWSYSEAVGKVPAGTALFGDDPGAPQVKATKVEHRLTTRYDIRLELPKIPAGAMPPLEAVQGDPTTADSEGSAEVQMPDMQALVEGMLAAMQFRFALGGPGRVVSTNGTMGADGLAEWRPTMEQLTGGQTPELRVVTEATNWTNLGRLADQVAALSGDDAAGTRLAEALGRGLLPNPPVLVTGVPKLGAADYQRLLTIIGRLDEVLTPSGTVQAMRELGLSADAATTESIAEVYSRVQDQGFLSRLETAQVERVVGDLRP